MPKQLLKGAFAAGALSVVGITALAATDDRTKPCYSGQGQDPVGQTKPYADGSAQKLVRLPDYGVCYIRMKP